MVETKSKDDRQSRRTGGFWSTACGGAFVRGDCFCKQVGFSRDWRNEQGYFLSEVVVTTFIVGVLMTCLWPIWSEMKRLHERQQTLSEAILLMQNTAEEQRAPCRTTIKNRRTVESQIYHSYRYQIEYQCRPVPGLSAWSVRVRWTNREGKVEQERLEGLIFHASTDLKQGLLTLR